MFRCSLSENLGNASALGLDCSIKEYPSKQLRGKSEDSMNVSGQGPHVIWRHISHFGFGLSCTFIF